MPQPKWYHKSLSELCMDSIVDNMENWTALRSSMHVSSLFYLLPSHCLEYIIQCLKIGKREKEEMFDLLINLHSKVLDLSKNELPFTESDYERNLRIVRLASVRCSQLTALKIGGHQCLNVKVPISSCVKILEEDNFPAMLQLFQYLQVLDLSNTMYGASCMLSLGSTCKPKLRELLVESCPNVTDTVIQDFCIGQKFLHRLSFEGTEVTTVGVKFAIEHLPELKELFFDRKYDILTIFNEIHNESRELKKYSLTKLSIPRNVPYKKGSISLMVSMCPALVELFMYINEGITDVELLGFRELKQITSLVFQHGSDVSFPFHGGVFPILQVHGHTLESLYILPPVPSGKVHSIIECCPNLQKLILSIDDSDSEITEQVADRSSFYPPKEDPRSREAAPLRMLKILHLVSSDNFSLFAISPEILLLLLSSPDLTNICFGKCSTLTDQIIEKACARNSFKNLTKLVLYNCPVKQKGIDFFMNEMNPLVEIFLFRCDVNIQRLKVMAKEKYWSRVKIRGCH